MNVKNGKLRNALLAAFIFGVTSLAASAQGDPLSTTAQKVIREFNTPAPYIVTIGRIFVGLADTLPL